MLIILSIGIWYYFQYTKLQSQTNSTEAPVVGQTTPTPPVQTQVEEGWVLYSNDSTGFTFTYPQEAELRHENEYVGVILLGPTQSQGTELYDGLAVLLASYPLNGKTLKQAAENEQTKEDTSVTVSEITPITYAGKSGFTYQASSLGTRQVIILPLTNDLYLKVVNSTQDPTNKGFQNTVEKIVSTTKASL